MPPAGTLAFTAAHGMINRVHGHTANMGTFALPSCPARFTQFLAFMLGIADLADTGPAFLMKPTHFTGGQFYQNIFAFLGHQLGGSAGASYQLGALAYFHFNIMDDGAQRDITHGETVSCLDIYFVAGLDNITDFNAGRRENISFLTIRVKEQSNIGGPVRIIFNGGNLGRNIRLVTLEVDYPVFSLVAPADMARGNPTIIISAAGTV